MDWYWWIVIGVGYSGLLFFGWCLGAISGRGERLDGAVERMVEVELGSDLGTLTRSEAEAVLEAALRGNT